MFTPALQELREHYPKAQIDAVVMYKGVEDIYSRTGLLSHVFYFDFLKMGPLKSLLFVLRLRGKYDASVNVYPSNRKEYNLIQFLAGAKLRAGVNYLRGGKLHFGFLNNLVIEEDDNKHNAKTNLELAARLGGYKHTTEYPYSFPLTEEDEKAATEFLLFHRINFDKPIVGIHAGCSTLKNHIHRRWPPENFAVLSRKIIDEYDASVLLFGGPEEFELNSTIVKIAGSKKIIIAQMKNLARSAALIKRCSFFVTNDSSLMHVASAMKRKVAAIIGPTNTNYIHPWGTEYKIISLHLECAPCFFYSPKPLKCSRDDVQFKCVRELGVSRVMDAIKPWLETESTYADEKGLQLM